MKKRNAKGKVKIEKWNVFISAICTLQFAMLLSGCAGFQVVGEIQKGHLALLKDEPQIALAHFERAAKLNPDYLLNFSLLDQGVWTYVGRAYYAMGKLPEAKRALERGRSRYEQDHLAKLYLGLVLVRDGDRPRGLREVGAGLKGLGDWLDDLEQTHPDGRYWDPDRRLRSEIQRSLAMIKGRDINWSEIIASGEWLGREFEEEIDLAEQDRIDDLYLNNGDDGKD